MISNNAKRLNIIEALSNPFDYKLFLLRCENADTQPINIYEYAQKVGLLQVAKREYPNKTPRDAYIQFIDDMNASYTSTPPSLEHEKVVNQPKSNCNTCGGGKVL